MERAGPCGSKQQEMIFVPGSQFVVVDLSPVSRSPQCCIRVKMNPSAYLKHQLSARGRSTLHFLDFA